MRRDDPKVIAEIDCLNPACNEVATVRQRSNGKKLYYTYCTHCKSQQMTGDQAFQKYVADNMRPVGTSDSARATERTAPGAESGEVEQTEPEQVRGESETENTVADSVSETESQKQSETAQGAEFTELGEPKKPEPELWRPSSKPAPKPEEKTEQPASGGLKGVHIFGAVVLLLLLGVGGYFLMKKISQKPESQAVAAGA